MLTTSKRLKINREVLARTIDNYIDRCFLFFLSFSVFRVKENSQSTRLDALKSFMRTIWVLLWDDDDAVDLTGKNSDHARTREFLFRELRSRIYII